MSIQFGMLVNTLANYPLAPVFSSIRFWDVEATWKDLNTANGVYNWTKLDQLLKAAAGKEVLYTFGKVPTWAGGGSAFANPPTDLDAGNRAFKAFVAALVKHSLASPTKISIYELWNEPNLPMYWTGTVQQLLQMTRDAETIIRALDPEAVIVAPADSGGNAVGQWLLDYYAAAGEYIPHDVFNYHAYLTDTKRDPMGMLLLLQNIQYKMQHGSLPNQPIWFTEGSWGQASAYKPPLTNDEQITYLALQYILMWLYGVQRYYWYAFDSNGWGELWDKATGMHPVGNAYALLQAWLTGSKLVGALTQNTSGTYIINLTLANGNLAQIVWNAQIHSLSTPAKSFLTLDNAVPGRIPNGSVTVHPKPILLLL